MPKIRVTLKTIASKLGVSVPTVSRALKDYPDISKETKTAVLKLVDELHYIPNNLALNLRKNKSNIIGVIIPEVVHFFFSSVIKGIMQTAENHGYSVLLTQSQEQLKLERKHAKLLFSSHVDGLLVCLSDETKSFDHFKIFEEFNIPLVLFDKVLDTDTISHVIINDREGAFQATEHLIHQGCSNILFLKGPKDPLNTIERFNGYKDALEKYNIPLDSSNIKSCPHITRPEAYHLVEKVIKEGQLFDAIFGVSDILSIGALGACQDNGIKVPEKVCIIGFSDSEMCEITRPQLSSVYQPGFEIGEKSTLKLIQEIQHIENDGEQKAEQIILKSSLKIRESSNRILKTFC
ncbi:LacI family DNA-binding transcriptional regulator [Cyclobacterium amurskyense]|uniref:LacI family DNA-binding transcriptional regulator n=1 Tax=Cyclobacterium amurskyense TaxID=320787 RepID=UPI0030DDCA0A|tara:strand:- start:9280 stop:10326 length:1047 start_codon:yes stop_codon:yes gene_type:complete